MIIKSSIKFGLIGLLATLIHSSIGISLIENGVNPLLANICAFVFAFCVSFFGHYSYSFSGHHQDVRTAFKRFFVVAFSGFLLNEILLATLLWIAIFNASVSLVTATLIIAISTFLFSKHWVFKKQLFYN